LREVEKVRCAGSTFAKVQKYQGKGEGKVFEKGGQQVGKKKKDRLAKKHCEDHKRGTVSILCTDNGCKKKGKSPHT